MYLDRNSRKKVHNNLVLVVKEHSLLRYILCETEIKVIIQSY